MKNDDGTLLPPRAPRSCGLTALLGMVIIALATGWFW